MHAEDKAQKLALVIEDEPDVSRFIEAVLTDDGYKVVTAADGVEGLKLLRSLKPDLVTLDINLPEKSGVRFYRDLREDAELADIPVVMVTGVQKEFKQFISHRRNVPPPEGYVAKPFDADQLRAAIKEAMG
jgi:DNA-binding response OmpR family regulator